MRVSSNSAAGLWQELHHHGLPLHGGHPQHHPDHQDFSDVRCPSLHWRQTTSCCRNVQGNDLIKIESKASVHTQ